MATAQARTRKRNASKAGAKGKANTRKPTNATTRKPKATGGGNAKRRTPTKGKPVTSGQTYLLTILLGKADLSGGYENPKDSAEANAQIRSLLGVPMDADRKTAQAALTKVKPARGKCKGKPISSRKELASAAAKVRI